jgi:uncharacterized protein (TIGR02117 family)
MTEIKKLFTFILLLFLTFSLSPSSYSKSDSIPSIKQDSVSIYIIKDYWHTGIRFKIDSTSIKLLPVLLEFERYQFIDIGWGDEEFYQNPDFEIDLAAQAILVPSSSVLRFAGLRYGVTEFIKWVDYCVELRLSYQQFTKLAEFVNSSFLIDADGNFVKTSQKILGQIIFYKSKLKYHLFNTCNMWVAKAVEFTGREIETLGIITAEQLFDEISELGIVLKFETK